MRRLHDFSSIDLEEHTKGMAWWFYAYEKSKFVLFMVLHFCTWDFLFLKISVNKIQNLLL